jgi:hypothetical protein
MAGKGRKSKKIGDLMKNFFIYIALACSLLFGINKAYSQDTIWACDTKRTCFYDEGINGVKGICFEVREGDERLNDTNRYKIVGDHCDDSNCDSTCKKE